MKIVEFILKYTQPFAVITFIVAGICALILGKLCQGLTNIFIGIANFMIFYGGRIFK